MNPIFQRAFRSAAWKMLLFGSGFCLNLVVAGGLGASASAPVYYLLNNLGLLVLLLGLGLENTLCFFYTKRQLTQKQALTIAAGWSITATLLFIFVNEWLHLLNVAEMGMQNWQIYAYVFGALLTTLVGSLFYAEHRNGLPNLIPAILNLALIGYCTIYRNQLLQHLEQVTSLMLILPFVTGLLLLLAQAKHQGNKGVLNCVPVKTLLTYSALVFATTLLTGLFGRIDIWLLENLVSPFALGNYIQTIKFAQVALLLPMLASFSLFPSFSQHMDEDGKVPRATLQLARLYGYLVLMFCLLFGICGPLVFRYLYGPSFSLMPAIFWCIAPGLIASATAYPLTTYFAAANKNAILIRTLLESLVVLATGIYLGGKQMGVYGTALGWSLANGYYCCRLLGKFHYLHAFSWMNEWAPKPFLNQVRHLLKGI